MPPTLPRLAITAVNVLLLGGLCAAVWPPADVPAAAVLAAPAPRAPSWAPPAWFPGDVWVLEQLDATSVPLPKPPRIRSAAAIVADLDRGEVLFSRDPDTPRAVASLTKLVSSLAMASTEPDLDVVHCVTKEHWPNRSGARSKFHTGSCHPGWGFLGAALVASDNRGAFALPTVADLEYDPFIERMTQVSRELRITGASWADPAGLQDENMATARDILKAVVAVAAHPELSIAASAPEWHIAGMAPRRLGSTNRLKNRYETLAAKTGYTDTAHYGFATVVRTASGRTLASVVLGAPTTSSRFADAAALLNWVESTSP